jgi:hypothetical protein
LTSDARPVSIKCVARTTLDIDAPILRDLKRLQKQERKSLGQLVSELCAQALAQRRAEPSPAAPFRWITTRGGLLVDLTDKEAVAAALDEAPDAPGPRRGRRG